MAYLLDTHALLWFLAGSPSFCSLGDEQRCSEGITSSSEGE